MKIINTQSGSKSCRSTLNYIIVVLGKYLQMIVSYHIHKGDLDVVEEDFRKFNMNYQQLVQSFYQVTGEEFLPKDVNAGEKGLESEANDSEYRLVVPGGAEGAMTLEYECKECSAKDDQIRALQKELKAYQNLSK